MKNKNKLTPKQKAEIIKLRLEQEWPLKKIAEKYNVTTQNISYYVRQHRKKQEIERKRPGVKTLEQTLDPIQFRIEKLKEVASDIQIAREEKVIHSLPTYHKLHIAIHNELREMVSASKDISTLNPETLKREIIDTISNLPPILRTQIIRELEEANLPNVIRLKTQ